MLESKAKDTKPRKASVTRTDSTRLIPIWRKRQFFSLNKDIELRKNTSIHPKTVKLFFILLDFLLSRVPLVAESKGNH